MDLQLLRLYACKYDIPIISINTEIFFKTYIQKHNIQHILEIGSAIGYSACCLLDAMNESSSHHITDLASREISYPHYFQACNNTKKYSNISLYL